MMKKYISECIGTGLLVLFGCVTAIVTKCSTDNYADYLLTALAFGLVIVVMAYSICNVSGCHINPMVFLGVLLSGKIGVKEFIGYVISQFISGLIGASLLMALLGKESGLEEENSSVAGLVIGFSLILLHILEIAFTATSVNLARSFEPAISQVEKHYRVSGCLL